MRQGPGSVPGRPSLKPPETQDALFNGICNHANVISDSLRMKKGGVSRWISEKTAEHKCPECGRLINWLEMGSHVCG